MRLIIFVVLALVIFIGGSRLVSSRLVVNEIECHIGAEKCPDVLVKELEKLKGSKFNKVKEEIGLIFKNTYYSKYYSYQYVPISKLVVDVSGKNLENCFTISQKQVGVDSDGIVIFISQEKNNDCIDLSGNMSLNLGSSIPDEMKFVSNLRVLLSSAYINGRFEVDEEYIKFVQSDKITIVYPTEGDVEYLVGSTRLVLSRLKSDPQLSKIQEIDLRYAQPVLR